MPEKKPRGRPRLPEARDHSIQIRMNETERVTIERAAGDAAPSTWIREAALEKAAAQAE